MTVAHLRSVLIAIVGPPLVLLTACAGEAPPPDPLRPVRTIDAYTRGGERVRSFSGTARAGLESRLSFKVSGTVEVLNTRVGDRVRRGQVLAELDPRDYQLRLEDAQSALDRDRAEARNAEANYARIRDLYENENASLNDLDSARAGFESARAAVDSGGNKLEQARLQLDYTRLHAPADGAISAVPVEVNENVQPGEPVVILTSGSRPEVEVAMPELFISSIREGQAVEVKFDALDGRSFTARVTEVGVSSVGLATTFPVKVRLDGEEPAILPGMAAEVLFRFETTGGRESMVVPAFAVGEDRQGRFVYVVETGGDGAVGRVARRAVTVGDLTSDGGLEITRGLEDGERVVTAGISRIQDGMQVRLDRAGD
jgi:RND family efflux transporter MFP subunit